MITFKCRECSKRLFVKDQLRDRRVQCPRCFKYLAVPDVSDRNWHLRGIGMALLTSLILVAVVFLVRFIKNGGLNS